jgi:hypothetical protein
VGDLKEDISKRVGLKVVLSEKALIESRLQANLKNSDYICVGHRNSLGVLWRSNKCAYPYHTGTGTKFRACTWDQYETLKTFKPDIPILAPICTNCRVQFGSIVRNWIKSVESENFESIDENQINNAGNSSTMSILDDSGICNDKREVDWIPDADVDSSDSGQEDLNNNFEEKCDSSRYTVENTVEKADDEISGDAVDAEELDDNNMYYDRKDSDWVPDAVTDSSGSDQEDVTSDNENDSKIEKRQELTRNAKNFLNLTKILGVSPPKRTIRGNFEDASKSDQTYIKRKCDEIFKAAKRVICNGKFILYLFHQILYRSF